MKIIKKYEKYIDAECEFCGWTSFEYPDFLTKTDFREIKCPYCDMKTGDRHLKDNLNRDINNEIKKLQKINNII